MPMDHVLNRRSGWPVWELIGVAGAKPSQWGVLWCWPRAALGKGRQWPGQSPDSTKPSSAIQSDAQHASRIATLPDRRCIAFEKRYFEIKGVIELGFSSQSLPRASHLRQLVPHIACRSRNRLC